MGAPIKPRGWLVGVDGMDLDHNITQSIHIISNEGASNVLSSVELGF